MNLVATFPDGKFATGKLDNQPNMFVFAYTQTRIISRQFLVDRFE